MIRIGPDDPAPVIDQVATIWSAWQAGESVAVGVAAAELATVAVAEHGRLVVGTSGSTGCRRLVHRSQRSWTDSFAAFSDATGITAADRVGVTGPLRFSLQLFAAVHARWQGCAVVDGGAEATVLHAVPAVLADLLDAGPPAGLHTVVVAGARLRPELAERATRAGLRVVEYYGATELSLVAIGEPGRLRLFGQVDAVLRDGVLWVRSPYLSEGYLGASQGPMRRDREGYATVGDRAELDPDGGVRPLGRDAVVEVGGTPVQLDDVEAVLAGLPGVRAAVVAGRPHHRLGGVLAVAVELDPGADLAEIKRDARGALPAAALPRHWRVLDALPRTSAGKVDRGAGWQ